MLRHERRVGHLIIRLPIFLIGEQRSFNVGCKYESGVPPKVAAKPKWRKKKKKKENQRNEERKPNGKKEWQ